MATRLGRSSIDRMACALAALIAAMMMSSIADRAVAAPYAAVVMDARSGEILHARNHDTRLHPASLTKMMTLYIAFEAVGNGEISLDTMVTVSRRAAGKPPSRLGLRAGQRIAFRHLIRAAALRSGNDAATAIAEAVSGSVEAFTARMNATAAAIGMNNTRFLNAHGLTQVGHYSTARDMTLLGRQLYFDYPQYYNLFSRRSEYAGVARVRNTNVRFLDGYRGADGIKTGYTRAAGFNLTASAERNGVRIIVTVFGGRSTADRHQRIVQLMDMGFERAPARVAVRRPAPPQYAEASSGRQGAGRVVRLRTAPSRSPFPMARPPTDAGSPVHDAVMASLREEVAAVLAKAAIGPAPSDASDPERAPEVSPPPPARPVDSTTAESTEALVATRAAGSPAQEPHNLPGAKADDTTVLPALSEAGRVVPSRESGSHAELGQQIGEALRRIILPGEVASEKIDPPETLPVVPPPPKRFVHDTEELGEVIIRDGLVVVPGLPPIAFDEAALHHEAGGGLWRRLALGLPAQTEFLRAGHEQAVTVPEEPRIVLTASDSASFDDGHEEDAAPRMVTRPAAPGAGHWSVRLGDFPSRFDAERTLLRIALSESSLLGMGERRVGQRGNRFLADIAGLTQDQAQRACRRLVARTQDCEVIAP